MSRKEQGFDQPKMKDAFNLLYTVCAAHATCITPFLHRDFGEQALGFPGLYALILMVAYGSLMRVPEMFPFIGLWLITLIYQRARTWRLARGGRIAHSRYTGYPWLAMKFPLVTEQSAKGGVEPLVCFFGGLALYPVSPGLAVFLMFGLLSLGFTVAAEVELNRARVRAIRDAQIEQETLVGLYQRRRNGF